MRNSIPFLTGRCRISARRLLHGGRSSATLFFVELPGAGAATGAERRLRGGGKGGREGERVREREGPTRPGPARPPPDPLGDIGNSELQKRCRAFGVLAITQN